jgi:hypothetical protein
MKASRGGIENGSVERIQASPAHGSWWVPLVSALIGAIVSILVAYFQFVVGPRQELRKDAERDRGVAEEQAPPPTEAASGPQIRVPKGDVLNDSDSPLFVVAFCGASDKDREIEGRLGRTVDTMELVTSATGTARINFSMLVPPRWYYNVAETRGNVCVFRAYRMGADRP